MGWYGRAGRYTEDAVFASVCALIASGEYLDEIPGPRLAPAPPEAVAEAEAVFGYRLPRLLRRLYLEQANGGFGPGYGVLGVRGGHTDDMHNTALGYVQKPRPDVERSLWPLCHWGCGIFSYVDCSDGAGTIWASDPNPGAPEPFDLFRQQLDIVEWFGRWVDRRLVQPAVIQDPETNEWRGATDAELAAFIAEALDG